MDRASKIAFCGLGSAWMFGIYKAYHLHLRIEFLEKTVTLMGDIMDKEFQQEIDEKFEEIAENFDEE